ncbi:MFS transporter [Nocardia sp. NPDC004722]
MPIGYLVSLWCFPVRHGLIVDRSNPRIFLPLGLILSAAVMLFMGFVDWSTSSVLIMFVLLFLLGMAWFHDWRSAFYMPAFMAIIVAVIAYILMRDTPQSVGLPPVEEYKNDYPADYSAKDEQELSAKEIFNRYILPNKLLWYIAFANVFVYLLRYGVLDWSPTYLKEVKHFTLDKSSWAYFLYEYAGIPGTLLAGWMSDKVFRGNRGATGGWNGGFTILIGGGIGAVLLLILTMVSEKQHKQHLELVDAK